MATIKFTSTDSFMDHDEKAIERYDVEIHEYVEAAYCDLRSGPDGEPFAIYEEGAWTILANGRRASDWTLTVSGAERGQSHGS